MTMKLPRIPAIKPDNPAYPDWYLKTFVFRRKAGDVWSASIFFAPYNYDTGEIDDQNEVRIEAPDFREYLSDKPGLAQTIGIMVSCMGGLPEKGWGY